MAERNTLDALVVELEHMPASHRRQVLAALTIAERETVQGLLDRDVAEVPLAVEATFEDCFSPWIVTRLKDAETGKGAMTPAARQALLQAARQTMTGSRPAARGERQSLLQIVLGAFRPRKAAI